MKKRVQITYTGNVQGVGFRYTVEDIAMSLGLGGWVMNAPSGDVEVVLEGDEEDIVAFMDKIKKSMGHYIRSAKAEWQDHENEFHSFNIRFH